MKYQILKISDLVLRNGLSKIRDNFLEMLLLTVIADVLINAVKACKVFWALWWKTALKFLGVQLEHI